MTPRKNQQQPTPQNLQTIRVQVIGIRFYNPQNGYSVFNFRSKENDNNGGENDYSTNTGVGTIPNIREGDYYNLTGNFGIDPKRPQYGPQFQVETAELQLPSSRSGIIAYLATLAYGIGVHRAGLIYDALGPNCLEDIMNKPELLEQIKEIKPYQADEIVARLNENKVLAELSALICRPGISTNLAAKVFAAYGADSVKLVKEDPYSFIEKIRGIGFQTADKIGRAVDIAVDSPHRIRAGIIHIVKTASESEGHCFMRPREIIAAADKLFGKGCGIGIDEIAKENAGLIKSGYMIREGDDIYLKSLHRCEERLARNVKRLIDKENAPNETDWIDFVNAAQEKSGLVYSGQQKEAIYNSLTSRLSVVTGGPGTGKSTISNGIILAYESRYPEHEIYLCSPTGRAAKRLEEVTGHEAKTIHRLLGYVPELGFTIDENNQLNGPGLLIADEVSMMDLELSDALFQAIPDNVRVVLVGDADQLPSVGPGSVLRDMIGSDVIPVSRLLLNYRQNKTGEIALWADQVKKGIVPDLISSGEVEVLLVNEPEDAVPLAVAKARELMKQGLGKLDFLCLAPIYKSSSGVIILNEKLREVLNPLPVGSKIQDKFSFRAGDKLLVTKNCYGLGVMNGDVGIVTAVDGDGNVTAMFGNGNGESGEVIFTEEYLGVITLAYCTTVHKAQGSEAEAVIMVLTKSHYIMLQRNLFYTGITRAKKKLIMICQERAVKTAVSNDKIIERHSGLARRLKG